MKVIHYKLCFKREYQFSVLFAPRFAPSGTGYPCHYVRDVHHQTKTGHHPVYSLLEQSILYIILCNI